MKGLIQRVTLLAFPLALIGVLAWAVIARPKAVVIGATAPTFELADFNGTIHSSTDLRGGPVVLNFWASWCIPCIEEADELSAAWNKYRSRGVQIVGINTKDEITAARRHVTKFDHTYLNLRDPSGIAVRKFSVRAFPETFFIDANGIIVARVYGAVTTAELETQIESMIR